MQPWAISRWIAITWTFPSTFLSLFLLSYRWEFFLLLSSFLVKEWSSSISVLINWFCIKENKSTEKFFIEARKSNKKSKHESMERRWHREYKGEKKIYKEIFCFCLSKSHDRNISYCIVRWKHPFSSRLFLLLFFFSFPFP